MLASGSLGSTGRLGSGTSGASVGTTGVVGSGNRTLGKGSRVGAGVAVARGTTEGRGLSGDADGLG